MGKVAGVGRVELLGGVFLVIINIRTVISIVDHYGVT